MPPIGIRHLVAKDHGNCKSTWWLHERQAIILDRVSKASFLLLVASLPFEFDRTVLGLSNLQWLFVLAAALNGAALLREGHSLAGNRVLVGGALFATACWIAALAAPEFTSNAILGATRVSAGLILAAIATRWSDPGPPLGVWCASAGAAAAFGLAVHFDIAGTGLFRAEDFFVGTTRRLSGSFEYPNTAAAFFAMSLPILWYASRRASLRYGGTGLAWLCLILTYSRGALAAVLLSAGGFWLISRARGEPKKGLLTLAAFGAAVVVAVSVWTPELATRLRSTSSDNPYSARYELEFTGLRQAPSTADGTRIRVINDGQAVWRADGPNRVVLAYRWYDIPSDRLLEDAPLETRLDADLPPGESRTLDARFRTPAAPGRYLLIWDLKTGSEWFSRLRVAPVFAEVEIRPGATRLTGDGDLSPWIPGQPVSAADASIPRTSLWKAALELFRSSPLTGTGPDNFRLLYGEVLGYDTWDTNIRSNNMYLEILATTGLLGFLTFAALLVSIPRNTGAISAAIAIFLVHGLVDVFLMTTPIYFAFWILVGFAARPGRSRDA